MSYYSDDDLDDDDSYEYLRNDEGEFVAEGNIMDRGSFEDPYSLEAIARDAGVYPEERKKHGRFHDKRWRFMLYTKACAIRFHNSLPQFITGDDITKILKSIKNVQNYAYKNPEAFVLGYAITKKNNGISQSILTKIIDELPRLATEKPINIKPTDLLRYARLWIDVHNSS